MSQNQPKEESKGCGCKKRAFVTAQKLDKLKVVRNKLVGKSKTRYFL